MAFSFTMILLSHTLHPNSKITFNDKKEEFFFFLRYKKKYSFFFFFFLFLHIQFFVRDENISTVFPFLHFIGAFFHIYIYNDIRNHIYI